MGFESLFRVSVLVFLRILLPFVTLFFFEGRMRGRFRFRSSFCRLGSLFICYHQILLAHPIFLIPRMGFPSMILYFCCKVLKRLA